jgi:alpha-N-arabinofuranosidase
MKKYGFILYASLMACQAFSQTGRREKTYTIEAGRIRAEVQPTMYGVFFEDINMAADGGKFDNINGEGLFLAMFMLLAMP